MTRSGRSLVVILFLLAAVASLSAQQSTPPRPAVPLEPITAILDAFQSHSVVALGEGSHGNEQGHAFRLSLIRDARFTATVNDIVVEGGNARYQNVVDRFVRGDDVPYEALRQIWENTTQPTAAERTNTVEFYRAVRVVNASLPRERHLRVLLGDPPIDWESPKRREQRPKWMEQRDTYPADLIRREVLAKQRRALVVYGDMHLQRKQLFSNYEMKDSIQQTVVSLLEATHPGVVFSIWTNTDSDLQTLQADIASWRTPSLALIRGTVLGDADFTFYYRFATSRIVMRDGKPAGAIPRDQWRPLRMEDQFDAVLYLGKPSGITIAPILPALCADPAYMKMRLERIMEEGPRGAADRLKTYCATVAPR
jgi:hypothetical protein